ncbi:MAG: alpha/beta fold hydrolase [Planctomycetaceae bacterium]
MKCRVSRAGTGLLACLVLTTVTMGCSDQEPAVTPTPVSPTRPTVTTTTPTTPVAAKPKDKPTAKSVDDKAAVAQTEWTPQSAARALLAMLVKGEFSAAADTFGEKVKAALPADMLETTWQTVQLQAGNYKSTAKAAKQTVVGPHEVVDLLCTFEKASLIFRVSYAANHQVAGLFFLPAPPSPDPKSLDDNSSDTGPPDVQLETKFGTLYGCIDLPSGDGPFPAVLVISGSGPNDRHGNQPALKSDYLRKLGTALAGKGIPVLRFDKRGSGKSVFAAEGEKNFRFQVMVDDAIGWISLLRKDKRFSRIGIIGHSQGSLVAMLTAQRVSVDAIVSIAGPARSIDKVIRTQLARNLATQPELKDQSTAIIDKLAAGQTVENVPALLQSLFRRSVQGFLISWMKHDPARIIATLKVPTLIVQGTRDIQVEVSEARALKTALPSAELAVVNDMNHVLRHITNDAEQLPSYSNPKLPLEPSLVLTLTRFLNTTLSVAGKP